MDVVIGPKEITHKEVIEWFDNLLDAEKLEKELIFKYCPKYNLEHLPSGLSSKREMAREMARKNRRNGEPFLGKRAGQKR